MSSVVDDDAAVTPAVTRRGIACCVVLKTMTVTRLRELSTSTNVFNDGGVRGKLPAMCYRELFTIYALLNEKRVVHFLVAARSCVR